MKNGGKNNRFAFIILFIVKKKKKIYIYIDIKKRSQIKRQVRRLGVNPNSLSYPFPLVFRIHMRVRAVPILVLIEG